MRLAILTFVLALGAAGCGSSEPAQQQAAEAPPAPPAAAVEPPSISDSAKPVQPEPRGCAGDTHGLGGERIAYATVAERETVAYEEPGGKQIATFGVLNENGHAMVFGVRRVVLGEDCEILWYRVRLPARPNGSRRVRTRRRRAPGARSHAHCRRPVRAQARPLPEGPADPRRAGGNRRARARQRRRAVTT